MARILVGLQSENWTGCNKEDLQQRLHSSNYHGAQGKRTIPFKLKMKNCSGNPWKKIIMEKWFTSSQLQDTAVLTSFFFPELDETPLFHDLCCFCFYPGFRQFHLASQISEAIGPFAYS